MKSTAMKFARDRRLFLAGLGATTALTGCSTLGGDPAPSGLPRVADVPPAAPQSVGMAADLTESINAMMKGHIDDERLTGGVTAVARRNKLVHFAAHGLFDREAGTPMRTDALFVMMSSTKPVTGVAVLQQQEEGRLSLDDKLSKFIPELKEMKVWKPEAMAARAAARRANPQARPEPAKPDEVVPANREITLRDLVTHTSGLNSGAQRQEGDTLATYMPRLKNTPLNYQPGTKWEYSAATGPDVLARVVEVASGVSYDRYLKERIFQPVGMKDTTHNPNAEQRTRLVPRYQKRNEVWQRQRAQEGDTPYFAGAYGLSATAMDYLQFEQMLLNEGTIHGNRVLKPESVRLMRSNLVGDLYKGIGERTQGTGFGVLVRVVLDPATCGCGRSTGGFGWGGAYGTMSWTDPEEKLTAVIMIQQPVDQVQRDFEQVIRKAIVAKA
jgi:CubicO group peptidase (beta-lactamase class C family)